MKKLTNYTPGPRGVTMKDGEVVWIKPGASIEVDADDVVAVPDLGEKPKVERDAEDEALKSALAEVAALKKQNAEQATALAARNGGDAALKAATKRAEKAEGDLKAATEEVASLKSTNAEQAKQIEELTKPAA